MRNTEWNVRDDVRVGRPFVGVDLGRKPVPDATICTCRRLLEALPVGEQLFARIGAYRAAQGHERHPDESPSASVLDGEGGGGVAYAHTTSTVRVTVEPAVVVITRIAGRANGR